jgi:hypothetical protein
MKMEGKVDKPIIVCDHCGAEIAKATDAELRSDGKQAGHFLWSYNPDGTPTGAIYFTHQECSVAFTQQRQDSLWCSKDLECLPVYLLQSLGISWNDAEKKVQWLDSLPD